MDPDPAPDPAIVVFWPSRRKQSFSAYYIFEGKFT